MLFSYLVGITRYSWETYSTQYYYRFSFNTDMLYLLSLVFMGLCFIEPILIFSFKMKRESFEMERVLPVPKKKMYFARYLMGYLEIILPYTLAYWITIFIYEKESDQNIFLPSLALYGVIIVLGIFIYSFYTFFFLRGRNLIDGIALMVLSTLAFLLIGNGAAVIIQKILGNPLTQIEHRFSPYGVIEWMVVLESDRITGENVFNIYYIVFAIFSLLPLIASMVGIFIYNKDFKVENASQKTKSPFGYSLLIPLAFIPMMLSKNILGLPIYYLSIVLVVSLTYLTYALAYRKFVFERNEWKIFFIVSGVELLFFVIAFFL